MNIYLLTPKGFEHHYETYSGAVVCARSHNQAKEITVKEFPKQAWTDAEHIDSKLIGKAIPHSKKGVILEAFDAG